MHRIRSRRTGSPARRRFRGRPADDDPGLSERVRRKDQTGERRQPGPAARRRRDARMQPPRSVRRNAHPDHAAARRSAGESRHETGRSSADLRESRSGRGRSGQLLFRPDGRLYCELHRVRHGSLLPAGNLDRAQRQQIFRAPARRRAKMGRRRIERHPSLHGRKMERVPLRHPLLGDMERTRSGPENVDRDVAAVQRLLCAGGDRTEKTLPAPEIRRARALRLRRTGGQGFRRELRRWTSTRSTTTRPPIPNYCKWP